MAQKKNLKPRPTPKRLELTPEQLEKVALRKAEDEASVVPTEWRLLAEFGMHYGWEAIRDVQNNEIDINTFNYLLAGARKVWAGKMLDLSTVIYTDLVASNSKKPQAAINKGLKEIMKEAK